MAAGILGRAVLLLQAKNSSGSGAWLDESGNGHDAQFGSLSGADTNDPLFLSYTGTQYLYLSGVSGNYVSAPDIAAYNLNDTFSLAVFMALDDWTPAATQIGIASWTATGNQRAYYIGIATNGDIIMGSSDNGTIVETVQSSAGTGFTNGTSQWYGLDFNGGVVQFFTGGTDRDDPVWVELGTDQTFASNIIVHDSTNVLEVGTTDSGTLLGAIGKVYRAIMYPELAFGGTPVFDPDFTDTKALTAPFATFTEASSNAATVTINRTSAGVKASVVDRDLFLYGDDDFHEIADHNDLDFANGEALTLMVMGRFYDVTPSGNLAIVNKAASASAGYAYFSLTNGTAQFILHDGTNNPTDTISLTDGETFVLTGVRNITDDDVEVFLNGVGSGSPAADSTTSSLANIQNLYVGARTGTDLHIDGEIMAVVLWREALSDVDLLLVSQQLKSTGGGSNLLLLGVG